MPPNLQNEELYSLRDIVRFIPRSTRTGRQVHRSVVWRWARVGLKAADGTRVFLEVVKAGGGLATSREALHRFFAELTRRALLPRATARTKCDVPTRRAERPSDVGRELDNAGF